jgi:acyl-CoA-binding protein
MGDLDLDMELEVPEEVTENLEKSFEEAVSYFGAQASAGKVPDDDMLTMYGFYKQATEGPCTKHRPAFFDRVGRAKW